MIKLRWRGFGAGRVLFAVMVGFFVAACSGCAGAESEAAGTAKVAETAEAEAVETTEAAETEEETEKEAREVAEETAEAVEEVAEAPEKTAETVGEPTEVIEETVDETAGGAEETAEAVGEPTEVAEEATEAVGDTMEETAEDAEAVGETVEAAEAVEAGGAEVEDEGGEMTAERNFYAEEIPDEVFEGMQGKSFKADCPIPRSDLRYLHVLHRTLEGETQEGVMVCHRAIADDLLEIFEELYEQGYPIERMRLVDEYDAVDEASMADNNSSCFNYRVISHTSTISKHGLGIAVDINPQYNPYTKMVDGVRTVEPANGEPYLDRGVDFPYKIDENDLCYRLFIEHGFEWGGAWQSSKDYQHFELAGTRAEEVRALY